MVPTSMTLNGVISLILSFLPNSIAFQAEYTQWLKVDLYIMSVKYCLPVPVFYFWPKLYEPCSAVSLRQLSILFFQYSSGCGQLSSVFRSTDLRWNFVRPYCCWPYSPLLDLDHGDCGSTAHQTCTRSSAEIRSLKTSGPCVPQFTGVALSLIHI